MFRQKYLTLQTTNRLISMNHILTASLAWLSAMSLMAQSFTFDGADKSAIRIGPSDTYDATRGYGYDMTSLAPAPVSGKPFFFSVAVPDGNYRVTLTLGSKQRRGNTTVRAESRRLMAENIVTNKGETKTVTFVVNKRNTIIGGTERVKIKDRERTKLNWDDKLTIEIGGEAPACGAIKIEPADDVTTLWLCGNSTVVDQDYEPWASWGQMLPRWMDDGVAVANYAESGETAASFMAAGRLKKILSLAKSGDYLFVEFGHNDQKQKTPGSGAYYNFATNLKQFIDEARAKGMTPIFVTPTQRRTFDSSGHITESHGDYPDAMRWVAMREGVKVIEVHDMTRTFYETMGNEGSKRAFVHYPANTFPGQQSALADNTHFNPYGAYEIAKMVLQGMRDLNLPVASHIKPEFTGFDPSRPDPVDTFRWYDSPFFEALKPDGN